MSIILETERLTLRRPEQADAEAIARRIGDWDVARMLDNLPYPYILQDAFDWLGLIGRDPESWHFAICPRSDPQGTLMGVISLHVKPGQGVRFSLGYWLGRAHWGRGYASEAARKVVDEGFRRRPELDTVYAWYFIDNPASARVLEKAGLERADAAPRWHKFRARHVMHVGMQLTRAAWEARP